MDLTPATRQPAHRTGISRNCVECGRPLNTQQALSGQICDDLACKGPYLQRLKNIETANRQAARARVAERVSRETGIADGLVLVLPANSNTCVPLSRERLETFRRHLRHVIAQAQPPTEASAETRTESRPDTELPPETVIHACATCRGRCCLGGAGHAFLGAETITAFWRQHPGMSSEAIEAEYLQHAASWSVADSCVFHADSGCTLPRHMRADTCNTFLCEGLLDGPERGSPRLYVAADGGDVRRAVLVDAQGHRKSLLPQ